MSNNSRIGPTVSCVWQQYWYGLEKLHVVTCNQSMAQPKLYYGKTWIRSWQRMEFQRCTSKVSWQTVPKQIGMMSRIIVGTETLDWPWLVMNARALFIGHWVWIGWPINISHHHYNFSTNKYARITKTPKQWQRICVIQSGWLSSGTRMEEGIFGLSHGWDFGTSIIGSGVVICLLYLPC